MGRPLAHIILFLFIIPCLYAKDSAVHHQDTLGQLHISLEEETPGIRSGICGEQLDSPIIVQVTNEEGSPVANIDVAFSSIAQPDQADGAGLSHALFATDSTGRAQTGLVLGSKPGAYRVACRIREGFPDNEVVFQAKANRKNWVYMLIIGLFGGLGLFLFGMHSMSEGMQQSAGERMRSILENVTRNRIVGTGIGTLVTTIIQSSSATSVMLVSFVNANLLQFRQTIPVLLGAAIGTTITAQMIAFKITEYSLLLVAVGLVQAGLS